MHAAQAACARLSSRSARAARVPQRVVAPLARDDRATTPPAAHRLLDDPQAARGAWTDHPTVEQDANHVAAEQAREVNPRQSRCPRLRDSVEIVHRRASMRHSIGVCGSGSEPWYFYSLVGRVPTSSCPNTGSTAFACRRSGADYGVCQIQSGDADDRGNLRRSTRLGLLKCVERRRRLEGLLGDEGNRKLEKVARAAYTGCSRPACRGGG